MGARMLGALLLLIAAALWGLARVLALRRARLLGEAYLLLLCHIRAQIEGYAMPVAAIFATADQKMLAACGAPQARDLGEMLAVSGEGLAPEVRALLCAFCDTLGTSLRAEQLRACDRTVARLEGLLPAARADAPRRTRLLLLLPPLGTGIFLLLFL